MKKSNLRDYGDQSNLHNQETVPEEIAGQAFYQTQRDIQEDIQTESNQDKHH